MIQIASLFLLLVGVTTRYHDHPLPLPPPNEVARSLQAWTVPKEDTVLAIERQLEQELGLQHRVQIPVPSAEEDRAGEFPQVIASSSGNLPGSNPKRLI